MSELLRLERVSRRTFRVRTASRPQADAQPVRRLGHEAPASRFAGLSGLATRAQKLALGETSTGS